jgi:energy-converting hydrogenase Eha subunit E
MSRDLRKYARQTNIRLLVGFLILLFLIGIGLIYALYGRGAALMGLLCVGAGLVPLVLIAAILWGMELFLKQANRK